MDDVLYDLLKFLDYVLYALTVGDAYLKGEIKKMNKNLKQMIQLNKQANMIALEFHPFFLCCCSRICLLAGHHSLEMLLVWCHVL